MEKGLVVHGTFPLFAQIVDLVMIFMSFFEEFQYVVDVVTDHFLRHFVGRISHGDDTLFETQAAKKWGGERRGGDKKKV